MIRRHERPARDPRLSVQGGQAEGQAGLRQGLDLSFGKKAETALTN
jgi:hypothetical protein